MTTYFNGLAAALAMEVGVHSVWINCRSSTMNVPRLSSRSLEERPPLVRRGHDPQLTAL